MRTKAKKKTALAELEKLTGGHLSLGEILESIRRCEETSQTDFADKTGISRSHLCDIEKGSEALTFDRDFTRYGLIALG